MDGSRKYRQQNDELFMRQPKEQPDTPTVGPLRINKNSASPSSSYAAAQNGHATSGALAQGSPSSMYATSPHSAAHAGPSAPLPYPDDRRGSPATYPSPPKPSASPAAYSARPTATSPPPVRAPTKPLPASPGPDTPDKDGLFQKMPPRLATEQVQPQPSSSDGTGTWDPNQEPPSAVARNFYAPFTGGSASGSQTTAGLGVPGPSGVNRLASTASMSTTRGARGSPPPPETPVSDLPTGGIEARYAAAGIAGPSTLSNLQAQSLAAAQRQAQYSVYSPQPQSSSAQVPAGSSSSPPRQQVPQRRWTPTEDLATSPHGPTVTYAGSGAVQEGLEVVQPASAGANVPQDRPFRENALEQDLGRLQVSDEPPPAYSSVNPGAGRYPDEKRPQEQQEPQAAAAKADAAAAAVAGAAAASHPAFANETPQPGPSQIPVGAGPVEGRQEQTPSPAPSRTSPPPLPEGWIAHIDPNSGQYYYIHLPTQSTQWEFPKGPTPLNLNEPPMSPTGTIMHPLASPTASTYGGMPMSPAHTFQQPPWRESTLTMSTLASPTSAGFPQPPPLPGVEQFKVAPTNGVYFGPYLRYTNMDVDNGVWFGSVMIVTDAMHPPTIHIHQSVDLSPDPRQLKANYIHQHQKWMFYRYDIDLGMEHHETKWTYAITSHLGCTRYEFTVAGRAQTSWRFIAHSGNDFAMNVNANERAKIGGEAYMWRDILQKHQEVGGFHAQLGMGNQINADRLWKEVSLLRQWTAMSGKDNRKNMAWTEQHDNDVSHAYFHYYTSHLDQPHLREAFAQIPHIFILDDHDIFDGYGSYPDYMQTSNMFKNIGRIGIDMYLLFQHHTTREILRNVHNDLDLFSITGTGWHFVKYLGPAAVVVGLDCRSERTQKQVMAGKTYQGVFPKIALLPPSVQHCILMISVPLIYPRLDSAEHFMQTIQTGKKAVNTTFNVLGKVTAGVAGVVGAKGVVGEGFNSVKKAVGKSGLMSSVLSPFGEIDFMDELRDQWTHESKDLERTYLIRTLQSIAHNKSLRMTFLSGDVNCCGAGLVHDPSKPSDHKTMYQIISSSVVNAPPPSYVMRMLHPSSSSTRPPMYVPKNGHRSSPNAAPSDTKEDFLDLFAQDVNNAPKELKRLMNRRNYAAIVIFDPSVLGGAFADQHGMPEGKGDQGLVGSRLSLAVDWMVQADSASYGGPPTVKYGPLTINAIEYGR